MKTQEGNKLISKFLGHTITSYGLVYGESENFLFGQGVNELKYHESWDWLMPVVKKINDESIKIGQSPYRSILRFAIMNVNIDQVWKYCIKFIKWYNNETNTTR